VISTLKIELAAIMMTLPCHLNAVKDLRLTPKENCLRKIILHRRIKQPKCLRINTAYTFLLTNIKPFSTSMLPTTWKRILQHYQNRYSTNSFTGKYSAYYLLFYESYQDTNNAIAREKEIKGWIRKKKWELINSFNPDGKFLNEELFGEWPPAAKTPHTWIEVTA
jgi:putative endonuclease